MKCQTYDKYCHRPVNHLRAKIFSKSKFSSFEHMALRYACCNLIRQCDNCLLHMQDYYIELSNGEKVYRLWSSISGDYKTIDEAYRQVKYSIKELQRCINRLDLLYNRRGLNED